jgi:hypothetical protein
MRLGAQRYRAELKTAAWRSPYYRLRVQPWDTKVIARTMADNGLFRVVEERLPLLSEMATEAT